MVVFTSLSSHQKIYFYIKKIDIHKHIQTIKLSFFVWKSLTISDWKAKKTKNKKKNNNKKEMKQT